MNVYDGDEYTLEQFTKIYREVENVFKDPSEKTVFFAALCAILGRMCAYADVPEIALDKAIDSIKLCAHKTATSEDKLKTISRKNYGH